MALNSIPSSKLHCCLVILILFILVFLSLPLLLIYVANDRYEETWESNLTTNKTTEPSLNCSQYSNGTANEGHPVQCPAGTFPCFSCPDICVKQNRICDGTNDCPDRSDESSCYDSNGAMGVMFKHIYDTRNKSPSSASALAKPESCDFEKFIDEQCACNMSEPKVIICDGLNLRSIPDDLLASVFKIRMSNNSIESIDEVKWPRSLTSLVLVHNKISRLSGRIFKRAPNLSKLYLSHNEIAYIAEDAFEDLNNLSSLQIESNKLRTFNTRLLRHTPAMAKIHLSENQIDLPPEARFSLAPNLKELLLEHNQISAIKRHWFSNMSRLIWLSLTHNQIATIEHNSFEGDYDLQELNLSFNRIKVIDQRIFAHRLNIQRLYLSGNPIDSLPVGAFREVMELKSLNLTQIEFRSLERDTFAYLRHLEFIYFEKFRYCHYAAKVRVCRPITDGLSSIEELLAFPILKCAVWIVALVCSLGNVFVLVWRSVSPHEDRTLSLFVKNLSLADLMMGVYLCTIGWQDWKFQHNFRDNAIEWMSSWKCTAIGFLAILSSELSVFILTIITIERHRAIISISSFEEEAQKRRARLCVTLAWLFSFLIAGYPLIEWAWNNQPNSHYYATNGLCLPLHIDQPFTHGWQYSAFIYLGINFSAVMIIIGLYAHMYMIIIDGHQTAKPVLFKAEKREDAILAIRFFFIVVTDCLCWIPIVVIKIMALANVSISASIYGWLVVFIIPINSALNPIVYTLAAPTTLRTTVCRLFRRMCYRFDRLTLSLGALGRHAGAGGGTLESGLAEARSGGYLFASHNSSTTSGTDCHSMEGRRQRRKTGSNSTSTCDTFDTSIVSKDSKVSFEAALLPLAACQPSLLGSQAQAKEQVGDVPQTELVNIHFTFDRKLGSNSVTKSNPPPPLVASKESSFSSTSASTSSSPGSAQAAPDPPNSNQRAKYRETTTRPLESVASLEHSSLKHKVLNPAGGGCTGNRFPVDEKSEQVRVPPTTDEKGRPGDATRVTRRAPNRVSFSSRGSRSSLISGG